MERDELGGRKWEQQRVGLIEQEGERVLLLHGHPYMSWKTEDDLSPRLAVAQMCRLGLVSQEELAQVFGISRRSVQRYASAFVRGGAHGLAAERRGPKSRWKVSPELKGQILFVALHEEVMDYEAIQRRLEGWDEHVSVPIIREVLLENGIREAMRIPESSTDQLELLPSEDQGQLWLELGVHRQTEEETTASSAQSEKEGARSADGVDRQDSRSVRGRRYYSQAQRLYLDRMEQGEYCAYAGGLLLVALVQRYSFLAVLKRTMEVGQWEDYSFEQLCLTLLYMDVFEFRSLEDFKRAYREEFGLLVSRLHSPTHFTLRRFLHRIREQHKGEQLMVEFAREYLSTAVVKWGVMYIDGHFVPYHGMFLITKGWHAVRKKPMKGSYQFIVVDEEFTPWMFLVRSSSEDLLEMIPELIEKARSIGGAVGIEEEDIIVVFDREGYSGALYSYLDGRDRADAKRRAIFISWAKYTDWVYKVAKDEFDRSVVVRYKIQKPKEYKYYETERKMPKYGKIRTIVVQREADKKRSVIYTNVGKDVLGTETVVRIMCRRWGEENLIKSLMEKHFINYTPGYVRKPMTEQPMVDNPKAIELKKRRSKLTSSLHKSKAKFTDKILKEADEEKRLKEVKKGQIELLQEIVSAENEILSIDLEIDSLPVKVRFDQAHGGRKLLKLDYEKKRFLDCIKVFSYNLQMKMCELLLNHYSKQKEILPALSMILNRGGQVKLQGGVLRVRLGSFKNPEIDHAARCLCEDLNSMNPRTIDAFQHPIHYEIM